MVGLEQTRVDGIGTTPLYQNPRSRFGPGGRMNEDDFAFILLNSSLLFRIP